MAHQILKFFEYKHLSEKLQAVSKPIEELARKMDEELPNCEEKTVGLRKLLEAKDALVRAKLEEVKTEVFRRSQCIYNYCPNTELCIKNCIHPRTNS